MVVTGMDAADQLYSNLEGFFGCRLAVLHCSMSVSLRSVNVSAG